MIIRIYAMKVTGQDFLGDEWKRYLSEARKAEAEKRKQENERRLCLGAEILMNRGLERLDKSLELPAAYVRNAHGKPYLLPPNEKWYVNWTHSGEYVMCVLADAEVGIDLQEAGKPPKENLVRRVLRPEEKEFYEFCKPGQRKKLFYEYWALKESFLKALGTGFGTSLEKFYINMRGNVPQVVQNINEKKYHLKLLDFAEPDYTAAVCWEGTEVSEPVWIEYLS